MSAGAADTAAAAAATTRHASGDASARRDGTTAGAHDSSGFAGSPGDAYDNSDSAESPVAGPTEAALVVDLAFQVDARRHGSGRVLFAWHPRGLYLASAGTSRVVHIHSRTGDVIDQVVPPSASECTALEWSADGSVLAIVQAGSATIVLWTGTMVVEHLVVPDKEITWVGWAKGPAVLAVGTAKGVMWLYNRDTHDRVQAKDKEKRRKRIVCGAWTQAADHLLAYASEDKLVTVCTASGVAVANLKLSGRPLSLEFAPPRVGGSVGGTGGNRGAGSVAGRAARSLSPRTGGRGGVEHAGAAAASASSSPPGSTASTAAASSSAATSHVPSTSRASVAAARDSLLAINVDGKSLLFLDLRDSDRPTELVFQASYGAIESFAWLSATRMVVAFAWGDVVVASAAEGELGTEVRHARLDADTLAMALHPGRARLCVVGSSGVRVIDTDTWSLQLCALPDPSLRASHYDVAWSAQGDVLTMASAAGHMFAYTVADADDAAAGIAALPRVLSSIELLRPVKAPVMLTCMIALLGLLFAYASIVMRADPWDVLRAILGACERA